jgi:tetratricopeptide (TPR) repeat protein
MRLVEISLDGDLPGVIDAQARLVDAYLAEGRGGEAQAVAEDLVARYPGESAHVERLRRALTLAGVSDVEAAIAERLSRGGSSADGDLGSDLDTIAHGTDLLAPEMQAEHEGRHASRGEGGVDRGRGERSTNEDRAKGRDPFGLGPIAIDLGDILGDHDFTGSTTGRDRESTEIDLSSALSDLKSSRSGPVKPAGENQVSDRQPPASLDEVFKDFRDEVSRQSIVDTAEQHYKVALAYKDVGMLAEAVKELQHAVRAPRLRFEAASLLGRLLLERGDAREAIDWFERAAEAPAPTVDAARTLLYDLGNTLESTGESSRALAVFLELQADAADFRDVARRVERLTRARTGG